MTIESVKMAADVYTPVSGKVISVNESISGSPATVNEAA
jgi:glycine cleavage system H protein